MLRPHGSEVRREVGLERGGEHRDAVLLSLAVAHEDLVAGEVEILHAKAQRLHDAQAGAVEERRDEARLAAEVGEDAADLLAREDDGQACGPVRPDQRGHVGKRLLEDAAVQEEERRERLVLGGGRDVPVRGEATTGTR